MYLFVGEGRPAVFHSSHDSHLHPPQASSGKPTPSEAENTVNMI